MKILVIGSTGRTGLQIVEQGIRRGHDISAFTRRPKELNQVKGLHKVIQGDGLSAADVRRGVQGQDAVVCSVAGGVRPGTLVADVTRNVIQAMREENVRRLILLSSNLLDATRPWPLVQLVKRFLKHALADDLQAERLVKDSGLDWTIIRPAQLTDKPATGRVRRIYGGTTDSRPYQLTRADLASAILDSVANGGDYQAIFDISNGRHYRTLA